LSETVPNNESNEDPLSLFPAELTHLVHRKGVRKEYKTDDILMAPGDRGDRIGFILSGRADVVLRDEGYREITVEPLGPGDTFGEINFLTGRSSPPNWQLVARSDCSTAEIPSDEFERLLTECPELSAVLLRRLAGKVIHLDRNLFESKRRKRALQHLISREANVFPEFVMGKHFRRHLSARIEELASTHGNILIAGESGVGREVLAHAIFGMSERFKEVFLLLDIVHTGTGGQIMGSAAGDAGGDTGGDTDQESLQSHLFFGMEELDASGSKKETPGYLELCEGGTLLVRGVEHIVPSVQRKIIEAIDTGVFRLTDSKSVRKANLRLIATTKLPRDEIDPERHPIIERLMERDIVIPPLRERQREIPSLASHYVERHGRELQKEVGEIPKVTLKTLLSYSWPGNDLELSNTLRRAVLVAQDGVISPRDIYFDVARAERQGKINLMRFKPVRQTISSPLFPAVLQSAVAPFFIILLGLLFLGPVDPLKNPASLFSWAVGWPALIGVAFLWARHWCALCPMGTLGKLSKKIISLEKPLPAFLKNRSETVVAGTVLFIIWLEVVTDMRGSPFNLGLLLLVITLLSVWFSMLFERQSWCSHLCPLGGLTGVMAKASILELRADKNVCSSQCSSHECYFGTDEREGCPFGQVTPTMHSNLNCKVCGLCVKNCPHGAINVNLRIPGSELMDMYRANAATAFLSVGLIGALLGELASKSTAFAEISQQLHLSPNLSFTIVFVAGVIGVNGLVALAALVSKGFLANTFQQNYARFGIAMIPTTLTAFLAFHVYYLINLGVQLPILVSQNFDLALFRDLIVRVSPETTLFIQQAIVAIGLIWTVLVMHRIARLTTNRYVSAVVGVAPHAIVCAVLSGLLAKALMSAVHT
jgi:transcriptional regulator with AAA-type ATPase domain/polyferredoxin